MSKQHWEDKHYAYFSNRECEYFPCHKGADPENFNCLFCYCPLYVLGGIAAAANLSISRMDTKIAANVCFPICGKIMEQLQSVM